MKKLALHLAVLAVAALPVHAQTRLAINDCGGPNSVTWSCASNTGTAFTAIGSVIIQQPLTTLTGEESGITIDFMDAVPAWWRVGAGRCRPADAVVLEFSGVPYSCNPYFGSLEHGVIGFSNYYIGPETGSLYGNLGANQAQIRTISAVDYNVALVTPPPAVGDEVFVFAITVLTSHSTGTDACAGCSECAAMHLMRTTLNQPVGVGDQFFYQDDWSSFLFMQGAGPGAPTFSCTTPANRTTWGQLKSLYR